jgi:hypothetical protein
LADRAVVVAAGGVVVVAGGAVNGRERAVRIIYVGRCVRGLVKWRAGLSAAVLLRQIAVLGLGLRMGV